MLRTLAAERSPIGLDLGGRCLRAVQLRGDGPGRRVEAIALLPRIQSEAPLASEDARRLREVLYRRGFTGSKVILGAPPAIVATTVVRLQRAGSGAACERTVREEFAKAAGFDPNQSEMAYWTLPEASRGDNTVDIMTAGCAHTAADELLDITEAAGFDVLALDLECAAIARWLSETPDRPPTAAVVCVEWGSVEIVVLCGDTVVYERSIPEAGLHALFVEFRARLGLSEEMFGLLIRDAVLRDDDWAFASADAGASSRSALTAHFERMIDELKMALSYVAHQYQSDPVADMYVIGEGSAIRDLPGHLARRLGVRARVA
ncbi:MAG: pilus assembly protein PilM, partial [Planctomycetota bacterium]|nr:pilus assembly protein PilM [Planctomycetota bacterium]